MEPDNLKIAIIGSRGIPCTYGGFETFAERLSVELVKRGHKVTVYGQYDNEKNIYRENYKGVECLNLRSPAIKALQKPILSLKSTFHSKDEKPDIVLFLGVSAAPFSFIARMSGAKTVVNLDGLEWKRAKWGWAGRNYLRLSEWIASKACDIVVADSKALKELYVKWYSINSVYIPYGAEVAYDVVPSDLLSPYDLNPANYILQSCRLEPENNVDLVIQSYLKSKVALPLVILGDAPFGDKYKEKLVELSGGKVRFLGSVYGPAYKQIVAHAALYIHAHEVGGTNPSLLEAMALGKAPLYLDVPFNREVAGETGFPFIKEELALAVLIDELSRKLDEVESRSSEAKKIIKERYSWSSVIDEYELLFQNLLK